MRSLSKYNLLWLLALPLIIIVVVVLRQGEADKKEEEAVAQHYYVLDSISQEREVYLNAFGRVRAKNKFPILSLVSGKIVSIPAKKGVKLEQNYVVVQIDQREKNELLESAKSKLDNAKILAKSAEILHKGGYSSESDILTAQSQLLGAEADFKKLTRDLDNCQVKIPYAGYIDDVFVSVGQNVIEGQKLVDFVSLDELVIDAVIPEDKISMIKVGTGVLIAFGEKSRLVGKVVSKSNVIDESTSSFPIEISISEKSLIVGQMANLSISLGKMTLYQVPQSALCLNEIGEIGIKVISNNTVEFRKVRIVDEDQSNVFVVGLQGDGEKIIAIGHEYAKIGSSV